jgi:rubrerythrin
MMQQVEAAPLLAALWSCRTCGVGWLSEPAPAAQTWYLYEFAKPGDGSLVSENGPAWTVSGPDPSVCPTCGLSMLLESQPAQAQLN